MNRSLPALALAAVAFVLPPEASAQRPDVQPVQALVSSSPMATYLTGHTTTLQIPHNQHGQILLHLVMLPNGTGWFYSEAAAPGGTWQPRLRYIYRWWIAQDGRLCYIYSGAPDRLHQGSYWSCLANHLDANGTPVFVTPRGDVIPVVSRVPGNALEARTRAFLEIAGRTFGRSLPTPPNPAIPPPP